MVKHLTISKPLSVALLLSVSATFMSDVAFAAPPTPTARSRQTLGSLFATSKTEAKAFRYPRARMQAVDNTAAYWGDLKLDARCNEEVVCNVKSLFSAYMTCLALPKDVATDKLKDNIGKNLYSSQRIGDIRLSNVANCVDSLPLQVGFYQDSDGTRSRIQEAFHDISNNADISVKGAKNGRLWAYVWDINSTPEATDVTTPQDKHLDASFFVRLPNGHPIEVELHNAAPDAFVMAGFRDPENSFNKSPKWNFDWGLIDVNDKEVVPADFSTGGDPNKLVAFIRRASQQGQCDADKWNYQTNKEIPVTPSDLKEYRDMYLAGYLKYTIPIETNHIYDSNARECINAIGVDATYTEYKNNGQPVLLPDNSLSSLVRVPIYLNIPDFSNVPIERLGPVTTSVKDKNTSEENQCLFPIIKSGNIANTALNFDGLGRKGLAELVCQSDTDKSKYYIHYLDVDKDGKSTFDMNTAPFDSILPGKYHCSIYRADKFHIVFADAEQVGALRMYEVLEDGTRVPLSLNWNDNELNKIPIWGDKIIWKLPGMGTPKSPVTGAYMSAPKNDTLFNCNEKSPVNARCWGDYDSSDSKNGGIGNADLVTTWTYYPISERRFFTLTVVNDSIYDKAMKNGCSSEIDPNTGDPISSNDTDGDGIPDVVEGKSNIPGIPDRDTNHDGTPDYAKPAKGESDSDGDGIPDKVECHFNGKHLGFGYVDGCEDTDGDGIPDYQDTDSDNDGVPDSSECHYDATRKAPGYLDGCEVNDSGKSLTPDYRNPDVKRISPPSTDPKKDSDGDGIPDIVENKPDSNHKPTIDTDNDGTPDAIDSDGDGIPDYLDHDSDNDGIPDKVEGGYDPKKKGQPGYNDDGVRNTNKKGTTGVNKTDDVPDYRDTDSDADGASDDKECVYDAKRSGIKFIDGCIDSTYSGTPDYRNPNQKTQTTKGVGNKDTDGDGIPDISEGHDYEDNHPTPIDSDGNGTSDEDTGGANGDSDGDGIPDKVECPYDAKNLTKDGYVRGCPDTDGDGVPDFQDTDSDGDGIPDSVENKPDSKHKLKNGLVDSDGDGIPDYRDTDSDNDGIPDKVEGGYDPKKKGQPGYNGDGVRNTNKSGTTGVKKTDDVPDYRDTDSDADGVSDSKECIYDETRTGSHYYKGCYVKDGNSSPKVPDYRNPQVDDHEDDKDGDRIPNDKEGYDPQNPSKSTNTDKKTHPDGDNEDADGDGIPDGVECHYDARNLNRAGYVNGCPDTDGDGKPDFQDPDSDGDGIPDKVEGGYDNKKSAANNNGKVQPGYDKDGNIDTDGDGIPDYKDTDSDGDGIPDKIEVQPDKEHAKNSDGVVNTTPSTGPDYQNKDSDGDGIPDSVECHYSVNNTGKGFVNGCEDTDGDGVPDYRDTDSDGDGKSDKDECDYDPSATGRIDGCKVGDDLSKKSPDYRYNPSKGITKPILPGGTNGSSNTTNTDGFGIVSGGCGCASTPDGDLPTGEFLLFGLGAIGLLWRRRKKK